MPSWLHSKASVASPIPPPSADAKKQLGQVKAFAHGTGDDANETSDISDLFA